MRRMAIALVLAAGCGEPPAAQRRVEQAAGSEGSGGAEHTDTDFDPEDEETGDSEAGEDGGSPASQAERTVKREIHKAATKFDAERLAVAKQRAELDAASSELDKRLAAISELERRLDERLGIGKVAKERRKQRIAQLAKMIINMGPQAGADIVSKMTDRDARALILTMSQQNERKASKLLSSMPGERAAQLGQGFLDDDPESLDPKAGRGAP